MSANLAIYVSVNEAAGIIGCTDGWVRKLLRSGELEGIKLNERAWGVRRVSAEKYAMTEMSVGRKRLADRE